MNLLALDLGTTTGFCFGRPGATASGTFNLRPSRHDGGGMRFVKFRNRLGEFLPNKPEAVVYEEVRRHMGTDAAHVYGGLLAILTEWCETNRIPYTGYSVQAIKQFAAGKGNAPKADVIAYVRRCGWAPGDDNEADAIALWLLVQHEGL